ncbi:MAG: Holliday junction branch migration protein RuvA [Gammaproteobacteria bacterium]|nr:Holliday junction branch migration protein RuvA [Gammaproteobacteria bacterium]
MIGRIRGTLLEKNPPQLLLDVAGVGYEIDAPMSTFYDLPAIGEILTLHIQQIVREDANLLYGFGSTRERALFRSLLKVNGVGARVALAILSGMSVDDFSLCVTRDDVTALTRIPGIGKKTAERLVVEMRDKLPTDLPLAAVGKPETLNPTVTSGSAGEQALEALVSLGYKPAEATRLIAGIELDDQVTVEDIIRAALKSITVR